MNRQELRRRLQVRNRRAIAAAEISPAALLDENNATLVDEDEAVLLDETG